MNPPRQWGAREPGAPPKGTIALLFTDIEGSTRRWERNPSAMQEALRLHDRVVSRSIRERDGYIFKMIGDAFCAAFWRVDEAVATACDAQRALAREDFTATDGLFVRMAIHAGTTDERDGDYFGPTLNRTARLLEIAHGGQTILSSIATQLARDDLPPGVSLRELGKHRLRDVAGIERIAQLVIPDLRNDFPRLETGDVMPTNLGAEMTPLIGRDRVLSDVRALLDEHRLVTLTGSGGVGKTRAAEAVARTEVDALPDGVWLVELANVNEPQLASGVVAATLNVRVVAQEPLDALVSFLRERATLLVLDNCEQIVDAVASLTGAILRACPHVRILATSREPLGVAGEALYRIPSLDVPPAEANLSTEAALSYGAVALFVERARVARGSFRFTATELPAVVLICRRLDGIPLAIELAAARTLILSARQLSERLDERFRLLTSGKRTALTRHRTLRAMIDWSYDLLSPLEGMAFRRLSAFRGAWTIDDAVAVCAWGALSEDAVFDTVLSLAQKSLLSEGDEGRDEFRLLETTRAYAREKLSSAGEDGATLVRFVAHVLEFARRALTAVRSSADADWLSAMEPQLDNVRGALEWTLGNECDVVSGAEIAVALAPFWRVRRNQEGQHWLHVTRAHLHELPNLLVARVLVESVRLDPFGKRALEFAQNAIAAYRTANDSSGLAVALGFLGQTLINGGRYEAARFPIEEGLRLARAESNVAETVRLQVLLAFVELYADTAETQVVAALFFEAEAAARRGRRNRDTAYALIGLAELAALAGDVTRSIDYLQEGLELAKGIGDVALAGLMRTYVAHGLLEAGDTAAAESHITAALRVFADTDVPLTEATVIAAAVSFERGEAERAALLLGFTGSRMELGMHWLLPRRRALFERTMDRLRAEFATCERWLEKGASMDDVQIVAHVVEGLSKDGLKLSS